MALVPGSQCRPIGQRRGAIHASTAPPIGCSRKSLVNLPRNLVKFGFVRNKNRMKQSWIAQESVGPRQRAETFAFISRLWDWGHNTFCLKFVIVMNGISELKAPLMVYEKCSVHCKFFERTRTLRSENNSSPHFLTH